MNRLLPNSALAACFLLMLTCSSKNQTQKAAFDLKIEQVTSGERHHFFGYIGQCQTIPWNASGRYILGLEIGRIDRMPTPEEAATVVLVDTRNQNRIVRVDRTNAWNPQQGTMFYWNPLNPESQFFFNDREVETGKVGEKARQVLYHVDTKKIVGQLGNPEIFPDPEGDISLSPDGNWFVNGYSQSSSNRYVVYRMSDGAYARSEGIPKGSYRGDIRIDPAPRWNRTNEAVRFWAAYNLGSQPCPEPPAGDE